jgi:RNA polymerase sigma-70 factor (ECF subfamily)
VSESASEFDYEATLAACAAGDRHALHRLYQQEGARLLGVTLRLVRDRAMAEDIVHDACLRIWTRAASFDPARGSARGWIYSVTRNMALNALRDTAREITVDDEVSAAADARVSMEAWRSMADAFDWRDHTGRIQFCLEQLDPARRNCIFHAYVDGYSHSEIAHKLGAPLGTVKAWIKRSLAALRECMA